MMDEQDRSTGVMEINLRPLTPADQAFLWQMLYQVIHVPEGEPPPPPDIVHLPELACYVEQWGRPGDAGYVALRVDTGEPVAAVWLRLFDGEHRGYGYVADGIPEVSLAVLPSYRGRGIGTRLLQRLLESPYGCGPISLSVSFDNRVRRLYERCGFEVVDVGEDSYTMLRK